jgi:hypothetical protein
MSRLYYMNQQRFDVSRRFSVAQRRSAWLIRKHPRKYRQKRGPMWILAKELIRHELTDADWKHLYEAAKDGFMRAAVRLQQTAQLMREHDLDPLAEDRRLREKK